MHHSIEIARRQRHKLLLRYDAILVAIFRKKSIRSRVGFAQLEKQTLRVGASAAIWQTRRTNKFISHVIFTTTAIANHRWAFRQSFANRCEDHQHERRYARPFLEHSDCHTVVNMATEILSAKTPYYATSTEAANKPIHKTHGREFLSTFETLIPSIFTNSKLSSVGDRSTVILHVSLSTSNRHSDIKHENFV